MKAIIFQDVKMNQEFEYLNHKYIKTSETEARRLDNDETVQFTWVNVVWVRSEYDG